MSPGQPWLGVERTLDEAVDAGVFPGAALLVGSGDEIVYEYYTGRLEAGAAPVTARTIYDLSSLTKPLATVSALVLLVAQGRLRLDDPVAKIAPEFAADGLPDAGRRAAITVEDLLRHRSGLPAVGAFWQRLSEEHPDDVATESRPCATATRRWWTASPRRPAPSCCSRTTRIAT
jgi:CubicO group peptidase (beta-lactamase class C family)